MNKSTCVTNSLEETQKLAEELAKKLLKEEGPIIIALKGELGGGKTSFTQGFAKGLGIKEKILSPTFNIFKKYKTRPGRVLYHFDCYRIEDVKEILDLGFEEIISNDNIVVIEWAERIKKILPKETIWINFKFIDETTRHLDFFNKKL